MSDSVKPVTRRVFLRVLAVTGTTLGTGCGDASRVDTLSEDLEIDLVDFPDLADIDNTVLVDAGLRLPIAITRIGDAEFIVTGTECDHEHCGVKRNTDGWYCPCHGSRFDLDGTKTRGPAKGGLTVYEWLLEGDLLTILAP
jgi:cytochrome b6-f complex iron-sulfur subunit